MESGKIFLITTNGEEQTDKIVGFNRNNEEYTTNSIVLVKQEDTDDLLVAVFLEVLIDGRGEPKASVLRQASHCDPGCIPDNKAVVVPLSHIVGKYIPSISSMKFHHNESKSQKMNSDICKQILVANNWNLYYSQSENGNDVSIPTPESPKRPLSLSKDSSNSENDFELKKSMDLNDDILADKATLADVPLNWSPTQKQPERRSLRPRRQSTCSSCSDHSDRTPTRRSARLRRLSMDSNKSENDFELEKHNGMLDSKDGILKPRVSQADRATAVGEFLNWSPSGWSDNKTSKSARKSLDFEALGDHDYCAVAEQMESVATFEDLATPKKRSKKSSKSSKKCLDYKVELSTEEESKVRHKKHKKHHNGDENFNKKMDITVSPVEEGLMDSKISTPSKLKFSENLNQIKLEDDMERVQTKKIKKRHSEDSDVNKKVLSHSESGSYDAYTAAARPEDAATFDSSPKYEKPNKENKKSRKTYSDGDGELSVEESNPAKFKKSKGRRNGDSLLTKEVRVVVSPIQKGLMDLQIDTPSKSKLAEDLEQLQLEDDDLEATPSSRLRKRKSKKSHYRMDMDSEPETPTKKSRNKSKFAEDLEQLQLEDDDFEATPSSRLRKRKGKKPHYRVDTDSEPETRNKSKLAEDLEQLQLEDDDFEATPSSRLRKRKGKKPHYRVDTDSEPETPTKKSRSKKTEELSSSPSKTPKKSSRKTIQITPKSIRDGTIEPSMPKRKSKSVYRRNIFQEARERLNSKDFRSDLPCRGREHNKIEEFLSNKLRDKSGGCFYISGMPGTGKTSTVHQVIKELQEDESAPRFKYIEVNGMKLKEPRQVYVEILKKLTGKTKPSDRACNILQKRFSKKSECIIMLIDELDTLHTRRNDVVINILNWSFLSNSRLIIITIANTMDLPERLREGKLESRIGLSYLTFKPYTYQQLQEIIAFRLDGVEAFTRDAVQYISRKAAAFGGDVRLALDICNRATELAEADDYGVVLMKHVDKTFEELSTSSEIEAIKHCSKLEKLFLRAVVAEVDRTGVNDVLLFRVYHQMSTICLLEDVEVPARTVAIQVCMNLMNYGLLYVSMVKSGLCLRVSLRAHSKDILSGVNSVSND